ncbi:MAG: hypothetical protein GY838_13010 [bacterium]|nr:hypothetical protein [bacterium]
MKCRIQRILAPSPCHLGPNGEAATWNPMKLELRVEVPKTQDEADEHLRTAQVWTRPTEHHGNLRLAPPALELAPPFKWPTCGECDDLVELLNEGPGGDQGAQFLAICPACGGGSTGSTPMAALEEFARELGPQEESG